MGLWDSILDFFTKVEYDKDEAKKKEDELNTWLANEQAKEEKKRNDAYEAGFESGLPDEQKFEYKEAEVDDDKTIEQKANEALKDDWKLSNEGLEQEFNEDLDEFKDAANEYAESAKEQQREIEKKHAEDRDRAQNNAIKNGLVNSSILSETNKELDKDKEFSVTENMSDLEKKVKDIDNEIEKLSVEKELKKSQLSSDYRKKMDAKINSLKADRQKEIDKIDKYNKDVAKQEKEYAQELKDYEKDYKENWQESMDKREEYIRESGYSGEEKKDYDNRLKNAYDFYKQLPKKDATEMIQKNQTLRKYLGYNYNQLLQEINK